jgi:XTP/dITP diphosphohydrolase
MKMVLASNNRGKLAQLKAWLPTNIDAVSMASIGFRDEIPEPFHSFRENAETKARTVFDFCGLPVLSDDSGLCVDALGGEPGVFSARYAGVAADDAANNDKLLKALEDIEDRKAHYLAVLCLTSSAGMHFFEGRCDGRIGLSPKGSGGFGYDPLFIPDGFEQTFAELSLEVKSNISHRAKALEQLSMFLKEASVKGKAE